MTNTKFCATLNNIKQVAQKINDLSQPILNTPDDNDVYVMKGGNWTKASSVIESSKWSPNNT